MAVTKVYSLGVLGGSIEQTQMHPLPFWHNSGAYPLYGESRSLGVGVTMHLIPVGILLDRLTEYPEECDAPPEVVAEAVAQLRERNPNGNETNW